MAQTSVQRMAAVVVIAVLLIGATVFAAATIARNSAMRAARQQTASESMLTAMLNQETGARGYFETHDPFFLQPYRAGTSAFTQALSQSRGLAGGDMTLQRSLLDQAQRSGRWHTAAQAQIDRLRNAGDAPTDRQALAEKATMDGFRAANARYDMQLRSERDAALSAQTWLAVGLAAVLSLVLVYSGSVLVRRAAKRERKRMNGVRELRGLLQVSESENESRLLLIRHIERIMVGSAAAVFNRNNSDDRLEPVISDRFAETPLGEIKRTQLTPRSCMAVRLSTPYARTSGDDPLVQCEVCGKVAGDLICEPLLVGGQVIGSVLVARNKAMGEQDRARVRDAVVQAAPILANQRNLALAELRAASDVLTGLPNRRSADETLKRMVAHASRRISPLAAVLLDLDHFKRVNDIHGHEQGDKVLAVVGQILISTVRASDFAARYGGEEFLILLPDADREMARDVAEKLRIAIAETENFECGSLTASFGVAALPDDASDAEQLMRKADRALYAAKADGRNRVKTAVLSGVRTTETDDEAASISSTPSPESASPSTNN
jgi:diguanylate cyclase (GGDEF)-like protein